MVYIIQLAIYTHIWRRLISVLTVIFGRSGSLAWPLSAYLTNHVVCAHTFHQVVCVHAHFHQVVCVHTFSPGCVCTHILYTWLCVYTHIINQAVCIHTYLPGCVCTHIFTRLCVYAHFHQVVCMRTQIFKFICQVVCVHTYLPDCVRTHTFTRLCAYTHIYQIVCVHTHLPGCVRIYIFARLCARTHFTRLCVVILIFSLAI